MEISYQLQLRDLEAANAYLQSRMREYAKHWRRRIWLWFAIGLLASYFFPQFGKFWSGRNQSWMWLLTGVAFFGSAIWLSYWRRTTRFARWLEQFTGSYSLVLTPAGLSSSAQDGRVGFRAWPEIVAFETTEPYFYLYLRQDIAFAVPRSALGDHADDFADEVRRLWAAHPDNSGKTLPASPTLSGTSLSSALWANLRGGARIAFFRDFSSHRFEVSIYRLLQLLFVELFCFGIFDYVQAMPKPEFSIYGLTSYGTGTLLTIAAGAYISNLSLQRSTTLKLLVMMAASSLVISLIYLPIFLVSEHLLPKASPPQWFIHFAYVIWMLVAVFRITGRLYRRPAPGALYYAGVFAFFTLALGSLLPDSRLYYNYEPDDDEASYYKAGRKLNVEDAFYRQSALMQKALAALTPQTPGKTDIYFVGFAGEGSEKVFSNEVRYARDLLDRRFGTAGHSLILLNNPAAADVPLANPHNLDAAIAGIAKKMNRQEDVFFLFLSSHGAKDHRLAVSQWPLQLNDLKAEELKQMLDRYGIRNRVIVVSACYSGGFLDVLKDDNTLVLTSSSRDHVSYGCGDYTEYTYFGESYFVKALAHEKSFIAAFDEARSLIEGREKSENIDPSKPQIDVGRNITSVLQRVAVRAYAAPSPQTLPATRQKPPM